MSSNPSPRPGLIRAVGRWPLLALSINDVVGSGIYLLPASAALLLGPASLWAVLLAGLAVSLLVLCYAQAASCFDQPGGAYLYAREAFGDFIGFEIGWLTWVTRVAVAAALANGFVQALAAFVPALAAGPPRIAGIAAVLAFVTTVNLIGVRASANTAVALVIAKLVPLLFFVVVGAWFIEPARFADLAIGSDARLGEAALLLLFAYAGFENSPAAAGEYRNPKRDLPAALLRMIVIVTAIYLGVQAVALGTLPGLAGSRSPLTEAAQGFAGSGAALLLGIGATLSILGTLTTTMLFGPRYVYAIALDGSAPQVFARLHPRWRTPVAAILLQAVLALLLALSGSFVELALLSMVARLCAYIGTAAAVIVLRRRQAGRTGLLRLPGGDAIPLAAMLLSLALLASARLENLIAGALAFAVGALIYRLSRGADPDRRVPPG